MLKLIYSRAKGWIHASINTKSEKVILRDLHYFLRERNKEETSLSQYSSWLHTEGYHEFSWTEVKPYLEDVLQDISSRPKVSDKQLWVLIFEKLSEESTLESLIEEAELRKSAEQPCGEKKRSPKRGPRVPQTALRHFYETLRMLDESALMKRVASRLQKEGPLVKLRRMIERSVDHFCQYDNAAHPFRKKDNNDLSAILAHKDSPTNFARCFQARTILLGLDGDENLPRNGRRITFVDYELSPARTESAVWDDGRKATDSGGGGVDLLLMDNTEHHGTPIVAELKRTGDSNILLAFFQALTYTVELATTNQIRRLRKHYAPKLDSMPDDGRFDIYIIFEEPGNKAKLLTETVKIVERLSRSAGMQRTIRNVVFLRGVIGRTSLELIEVESVAVSDR